MKKSLVIVGLIALLAISTLSCMAGREFKKNCLDRSLQHAATLERYGYLTRIAVGESSSNQLHAQCEVYDDNQWKPVWEPGWSFYISDQDSWFTPTLYYSREEAIAKWPVKFGQLKKKD